MKAPRTSILTRLFPNGVLDTGILQRLSEEGGAFVPNSDVTFEDIVELENMIIEPWELQLIKVRVRILCSATAAKMEGMKPTQIQALIACDGVTLDAAIKKLVKECGEDLDVCRDLVSGLWREGLIKITNGKGSAQARVDLTDSGRHKVATHGTRKTAYNALDDILSELGEGT